MIEKFVRKLFIKQCQSDDKEKCEGAKTPEDIRRIDNLVYGPDPKWHSLDIYYPKAAEKPYPLIVSVHGGGWCYGDKELYQYYCMELARPGFAVVNFSYPLVPEASYPSLTENTNRVFKWVSEHAEEYGFDLNNVFALGDSSGAHALAQYCCIHTDPSYAKKFDFADDLGLLPRAIALNCGIYEFHHGYKMKFVLDNLVKSYCKAGSCRENLENMTLLPYVNKDFPSTYLMTCNGDFLLEQTPIMKKALDKAGVENEVHIYGDSENELGHVFHCDIRLPQAAVCNAAECDFFKKYIR